jgi:hypothetical protein
MIYVLVIDCETDLGNLWRIFTEKLEVSFSIYNPMII